MMLMMDPPQHTAFRKLIRSRIHRARGAGAASAHAALAREIVDAVIGKRGMRLRRQVAGEMPSFVIAELLGLPRDDGRELYKLTETIHTAPKRCRPAPARKR